MHVLLIEPDAVLAGLYVRALKASGHVVSYAKGAQAAVLAADAAMPDVVVMEMQIPGHNGIEFVYEFRSYPEWQAGPIVLHTFLPPRSLGMDRRTIERFGVADILYKPQTTLAQLTTAVSRIAPATQSTPVAQRTR